MSWFTRSIANTLNLGDDDDGDDNTEQHRPNNNTDKDVSPNQTDEQQSAEDDSPLTPGRGVKEDLSEITKTLTRQFWGVASFLAPPPSAEHSDKQSVPSDPEDVPPEAIYGIRRDFAEIGGRFRSGISKLSNNIDVGEITKMASSFLQLGPEDENYDSSKSVGAIGVTDEVVAFVRDVAMHPETWLDFPLPEDEDEDEDFDLSDAQQEHALAVESLVPRLAALRIELCPGYMSECSFWKIYFVLVHPRLERHAAALLSTPEIMKARASLTQELKSRSKAQSSQEGLGKSLYPEHIPTSSQEEDLSRLESVPLETEKHPIPSEEVEIIDKSVIEEEPPKTEDQKAHPKITETKDEDDADDWLKEESSEMVTGTTTVPIENDEDVSFSDLEEDDTNYKRTTASGSDSSTRDWVSLGGSSGESAGQVRTRDSETKESNDWLDIVA